METSVKEEITVCNQHTNLSYVLRFKLLILPFPLLLSWNWLESTFYMCWGWGKILVPNVPRDSWGLRGKVVYMFPLRVSSSKLFASLSSRFLFPSVPTVYFLHDVTPQKLLLSILCHFPQRPWTQGYVYTRLSWTFWTVEEFHRGVCKATI